MTNPFETLEWEELCDTGRLAAGDIDRGKWTLGNIAVQVVTRYDRVKLNNFAIAVNRSKGSIRQYREVCEFYDFDTQVSLFEDYPLITWTHCREAMKLGSLKNALTFLQKANDLAWTVEQTRLALKTPDADLPDDIPEETKTILIDERMTVRQARDQLVEMARESPNNPIWLTLYAIAAKPSVLSEGIKDTDPLVSVEI